MGPCVRRDDVSYCGGNRVMRSPLRLGVIAGIVTLVLDQASKYWLLYVFDIGRRGAVRVTPFFDLVLAWNIGISFGWFQNDSQIAQMSLMVVKAIAVIALSIWMARSQTVTATVALGLIIGGAVGNAIDRLRLGAVTDFIHVTWAWFPWVFNLADSAISIGSVLLIWDLFLAPRKPAPG